MESSKKDKGKDIISIPLYYKESKDLFVGKGSLKCSKNLFKFITPKPPEPKPGTSGVTISSKYAIKEFTMEIKDKKRKPLIYKGREAPQDSNYILMKYTENRQIQMCSANKWINFIQSMNYSNEKIDDKEDKKKEEIKKKNALMKTFFNFDIIEEMQKEKNPKKNTRKKKKGLLDNNKEEEDLNEDNKRDDDEDLPKKKKKTNKYDFEEDSHSSEIEQYLEDISDNDESERIREEKEREKEEKRKEEERKREEEKRKENDDDDDEDDKSFENASSEVNENEDDFLSDFDLLNKKRKREGYPDDKMKEELENLLRKKYKMTYDEITEELMKKFKPELVQKYIEKLIEENTKEFLENNVTYYFLK